MSLRNHLIDVRRLSCWRTPLCNEASLSPSAVLLILAVVAVSVAAIQFFQSGGADFFSLYGINSVIASTAIDFAVVVLFARADRTPATLRNLVLLYAVATAVGLIASQIFAAANTFTFRKQAGSTEIAPVLALAMGAAATAGMILWMTGAARQAFKPIPGVRRPGLRAFAFVTCLFLAGALLPNWPVFEPKTFDSATANIWEVVDLVRTKTSVTAARGKHAEEGRKAEQRAAHIEGQQPVRLDAAFASVNRRDPDKPNIFMIGLSGYGNQGVFEHETRQSIEILRSRFDIGDRVVQLVNADDATDRYPVASIQNLAFALRAMGARMDHDKDVLILTMTSHGSQDGFALSFGGLIYRTLDAVTLRNLLDDAGIKNRILILSSCYSGTFVPVLANDDTMIMTAASSTRTSFGCANGREWTYFGDALFAHGVKTEPTLAAAFGLARKTIGQWEKEQHLTPSDPQIFVGQAIARRFPRLVGEKPQRISSPDEAALAAGEPANRAN